MNQELLLKANLIKTFREKAEQIDNLKFQEKRKKFLEWLTCQTLETPQLLEMYNFEDQTLYGKKQVAQYFNEYKFCNTRTQIPTETRAECDNLPFEASTNLICDICISLIDKKFHFAVFYAEGQRSPHIIIYDFDELRELNSFQRLKARAKFWRWVIPFRVHLLDQGLWNDDHYVPVEFAPHWKYGTPFNLLFEYIPQQNVIDQSSMEWKKAYSKLRGEGLTHEKAMENMGCKIEEKKYTWLDKKWDKFELNKKVRAIPIYFKNCVKCGKHSYLTASNKYFCTNRDCLFQEALLK